MQDETPEVPEGYDELEVLKNRCDMLGIKYHPNSGAAKLRAKLDAHNSKDAQGLQGNDISSLQKERKAGRGYLTHAEYVTETAQQKKKDIAKLVRVRITCMNPNKSEWEGEIFSVGSAKMGTFKKYVPFNAEDGWHIPHIMFEAIKERKYTQFYNARGPRGEKSRKGKLMPEFSVEVLEPLTEAELKELAQRQMMREGQAA